MAKGIGYLKKRARDSTLSCLQLQCLYDNFLPVFDARIVFQFSRSIWDGEDFAVGICSVISRSGYSIFAELPMSGTKNCRPRIFKA